MLDFFDLYFVACQRRNNSPVRRNRFPLWRRTPETADGYQGATKRRTAPKAKSGDSQMRTLSFMLAFAFVLAGSSLSGSSDVGLPGIGAFAYNGSPIVTSAPEAIVVAAR
jgi:hypothetical protein